MDTIVIFFVLLVVAAIFVMRGNSEGWRPFAWYGAPPGTSEASGDWTGIVPSTRVVSPEPTKKPSKKDDKKKKSKKK